MRFAYHIPHIIDDFGLSPEGYRLYSHLARMTANGARPYRSAPGSLAEHIGLPNAKLSTAIGELESSGLITVTSVPIPGGWQDAFQLVDLAPLSDALYAEHPVRFAEDLRALALREAVALIRDEQRAAANDRPPRSPGYIYLVQAGGRYKIGKATDVTKRIKSLQTGSAEEIRLIHTIPTQRVELAEKQLHTRFKAKRERGEWFDLSAEDVAWLCELTVLEPDLP